MSVSEVKATRTLKHKSTPHNSGPADHSSDIRREEEHVCPRKDTKEISFPLPVCSGQFLLGAWWPPPHAESGPCSLSLCTNTKVSLEKPMVTSRNDAPSCQAVVKLMVTAPSYVWPDVGKETLCPSVVPLEREGLRERPPVT